MPGVWRWGSLSVERDKMMICTCSREQFTLGEMGGDLSPESVSTTREFSHSGFSSKTGGDADQRTDRGNIEEAESSLREGISLNYEEARALLGRLEYQRGNIEAALHVYEGIVISSIIPKIRSSIVKSPQAKKGRSRIETPLGMPIHTIILLLEAIFLKSKCLEGLGKPKEAAEECKIVIDAVESAMLQGIHTSIFQDGRLQEVVKKSVELLPELWKKAGMISEAMAGYRQALLNPWGLDSECSARLQKDFAVLLLYSGVDVGAPSLGSQNEGSYIPKNNIEEAILLLLILLRKFTLKKISWDPTIIDHLSYALAISGHLGTLASQMEELIPGLYDRAERWYTLSLCYSGDGQDEVALNLLRKIFNPRTKPYCIPALVFASKLSVKSSNYYNEGVLFARRALEVLEYEEYCMKDVTNHLLGINLVKQSKFAASEEEKVQIQHEAMCAFDKAISTSTQDSKALLSLGLLNAEKRNFDTALHYANMHLNMEVGSSIRGWRLISLIFSAQQHFHEAELVIDTALDQTVKWEQGELLHTKAKLQTSQGKFKDAIRTYGQLLALVQAQRKCFGSKNKFRSDRNLELESWQDLAHVYISLEKWHDVGVCLDKASSIKPNCALTWHARGVSYQAQKQSVKALNSLSKALAIDPENVPSLVSMAEILYDRGDKALPVVRSLLTDALKFDRDNHKAWLNLGIVHKQMGKFQEAAECFQAAYLLEQTTPVQCFGLISI